MSSLVGLLSLLYIWGVAAQDEFFPTFQNPFGSTRLTGERGGPPPGAEFTPIKVINIPNNKLASLPERPRPLIGRPPPPPPLIKPTRRPRPTTSGPQPPIAPPPLPIPVPSSQGIPQRPKVPGSGSLPERPVGVTVVTPTTEIRPDLETVATTLPPPSTTTPNTADSAPAYYQRFIQNDDGSYYFDFSAPNTIQRLEQGFFKHDDFLENPILVKSGVYAYTSPEGIPFRVDYVADERGYRAYSIDPYKTGGQVK